MKRLLLAALLLITAFPAFAVELTPPPPPVTKWIGYAVSPTGRVFRSYVRFNEAQVRAEARAECEAITLRSCPAAIAVQPTSYVVAIVCGREAFIGGSNIDLGAASWIANNKATQARGYAPSCRNVFSE
jgi:hypothetical protein